MSLKTHAITTAILIVGGVIGGLVTEEKIFIGAFVFGIILGLPLGFHALFFAFSKKTKKRRLSPTEQFREAFGDDDNSLRIKNM